MKCRLEMLHCLSTKVWKTSWNFSNQVISLYYGLFTDYLRKIIVQGRSSKSTKVGDIMTEEVYIAHENFIFTCRITLHGN